jgi:hypothetical protein
VQWYWHGKAVVLGEKAGLYECHVICHRSYMKWTGVESRLGPRNERPASDRLNHDVAARMARIVEEKEPV